MLQAAEVQPGVKFCFSALDRIALSSVNHATVILGVLPAQPHLRITTSGSHVTIPGNTVISAMASTIIDTPSSAVPRMM